MAIDLYKNRCDVYDGEKPYIFVSYSHKDIEKVLPLIRKLQNLGFRVWCDLGVPAGTEWQEEIAGRLKNSGCVLSLLTPNSVKSKHFKLEFNYANYLNKSILVVYMENCELSPGLEIQVVSQQCIKCEHCENDEDLLVEIARAAILRSCLGEKQNADAALEENPKDDPDGLLSEDTAPRTQIDQLREEAENGSVQAQIRLAWAYRSGDGAEQNYEESTKWFRLAAEQGNAHAQCCLGVAYVNGWGVEENMKTANEWYLKAAAQGEATALNNLAWSYENGSGIQKDPEEAVRLYRLAAELGMALACSNLARLYENGILVEQSWEEAVRWHRRAAERGLPYNQWKMAQCYREGLGVPIDADEAARWQKLYDENPNK